jgi:DNA polymerase V
MMKNKLFALVDCNNFFVSCEILFKPYLRNKPVIVLSNNDGCVISRSNEAKELGIKMAEPYFKIKDFCKAHNIYVFSCNHRLYKDISNRVMKILSDFMPKIEIYSIDEAFLDVTGLEDNIDEYCYEIQNNIKKWIGITVSIGVSYTKTLAKMAVSRAKKNRTNYIHKIISQQDLYSALSETKIEDIWGIGKKNANILQLHNINYADQLAKYDVKKIRSICNINIERIIYELNCVSCIDLAVVTNNKSIASSRSFGVVVKSMDSLDEAVSTYITRAAIKLREQNLYAQSIYLYLESTYQSNHIILSDSCNLEQPTNYTPTLITFAMKILRKIYSNKYQYKKCGIILMDLVSINNAQFSLFDEDKTKKNTVIMKMMDGINKKFGSNILQYASCGYNHKWKAKDEYSSNIMSQDIRFLPKIM